MNSGLGRLGIEQKAEAFPLSTHFHCSFKIIRGNYIDHAFKSRYQMNVVYRIYVWTV